MASSFIPHPSSFSWLSLDEGDNDLIRFWAYFIAGLQKVEAGIGETAVFLNEIMGLSLTAGQVKALEARTESWIAGLQLAALSMHGRKDIADFIDAFSGSHRFVIDYLADEVLQQQDDEIRQFLYQTAILDRLTTDLCDAVTQRNDSQTLLTQLEQAAIQPDDKVLEVAVGPGLTLLEILKRVDAHNIVYGVDISPEMLRLAEERANQAGFANIALFEGNARDLPFDDNTFDVLYNGYMLDLIPLAELPGIVQEFKRVLKRNGRLVLLNMSKKDGSVIIEQYGGPEVLQVVSADLPEPRAGEVRVRILAAGVSYADLLMREGVHPETKKPPFTPGWDFVGVVEKVRPGCSTYEPGQMVAGLPVVGAYANFICLPEKALVPVPDGLDLTEAVSLVLNYVTGYQMMHRSVRVSQGRRVLIHAAAGGVGTAQLQLGQLAGLEMYGTASTRNHDFVASFGATPIDYRQGNFVEEIRRLTGDGVDVVFDGVGGSHVWRSYLALRPGGRVIAYGLTESMKNGRLANGARSRTRGQFAIASQIAGAFLIPDHKRIALYSIQTLRRFKPSYFQEDMRALFDLLAQGRIKPLIAATFPLNEVRQAHELLAEGVRGKIVLLL